MDLGLKGRVAVITGPAKGMGAAVSKAFATEGCRLALRGRAGRMAFSASKWGLRGVTKSFALEVGQYNINVNYLAPGMVDGPRFRDKVCADMARKLNITVEEAAQRHANDYALRRVTTD